ncbi:hypothetical protein [Nocardiopsis sp. CNR-923]|uniref:hypothetical protein n=1 Tax=Nocardiopsis sp. CNR-923 TaxID=1904965 RepID=UPI00096A789A|nr:hypothetical protein [Nocardiopsis sp. CNR-923]
MALAQHDFSAVFRIARQRAGISFGKIGDSCGIKADRVSKIARGQVQITSFDKIIHIADGMRIPGRLLGLAPRPWESVAPASTDTRSSTEDEEVLAVPEHPPSGEEPFAVLSVEEAVAVCAQESARYGARIDTPIGFYTIEELASAVHDLAAAYPYRPVLPSLIRARELRQRAWTLRERCHRPDQQRDLHRIAGWLCAVLANASFDLGGISAAQTQARVADLHGELVGDHGLRAWVRGLQALVAYWDGCPEDAVAYAQAANQFRPSKGTALLRAASIRARALAQLRRAEEADAALIEAEEMRENAQEDLPGVIAFPHAKQLYWASSTHLNLGGSERIRKAEMSAAEAITLYESAPPAQRRTGELSHARLDRVTARLARSDLDGLSEDVDTVLSSMSDRRIESTMRRLAQLAAVLDQPRPRANRHLAQVREAIEATVSYSPAPVMMSGNEAL